MNINFDSMDPEMKAKFEALISDMESLVVKPKDYRRYDALTTRWQKTLLPYVVSIAAECRKIHEKLVALEMDQENALECTLADGEAWYIPPPEKDSSDLLFAFTSQNMRFFVVVGSEPMGQDSLTVYRFYQEIDEDARKEYFSSVEVLYDSLDWVQQHYTDEGASKNPLYCKRPTLARLLKEYQDFEVYRRVPSNFYPVFSRRLPDRRIDTKDLRHVIEFFEAIPTLKREFLEHGL